MSTSFKRKFSLTLMVLILAAGSAWARGAGSVIFVPAPEIVSPDSETLSVDGKEAVVFEWTDVSAVPDSSFYDFRLYKGYEMTAHNLVLKRRVRPTENHTSVEAGQFEKGQIYSWAVRQVFKRGTKSRRNFHSFKVV